MLLLKAKIQPPHLRERVVMRPLLLAHFGRKLTLLAAPAGAGKTTLLAQWLPTCPDAGWLSLDERDNDPHQFLAYLFASLRIPEVHLPIESRLAYLANHVTEQHTLILDDYHLIHNPAVHEMVVFLLEYAPLKLIVSTRSTPPLPLARYRARHQLGELTDLRFSEAESTQFLTQTLQLDLSDDDCAAVQNSAAGWVTGLQLAGLTLTLKQHPPHPHHFIFEYLAAEVFEAQPPDIQQFLLQTAILESLHDSLCNAITGQPPGTLEKLRYANLFTFALGDGWYHYHPLFHEFLRARVPAHPDWHRQAARWYAAHGFLSEAVAHGMTAADFESVAGWILAHADSLWTHHEMNLLAGWASAFPQKVRHAFPKLILYEAWARLMRGELHHVTALLAEAENLIQDETQRGILLTIRGALSVEQPVQQIEIYQMALLHLPLDLLTWRSAVYIGLGRAHDQHNELAAAARAYRTASALCMEIGNLYGAVYVQAHLGRVLRRQGKIGQAARVLESAVQLAPTLPIVAWAQLSLAEVRLEEQKLNEAVFHAEAALNGGKQIQDKKLMALAYRVLAHVQQARGIDSTPFLQEIALLDPELALPSPLVDPLSETELAILRLLAQGLSNQAIADTRIISITTVKWHLKNIYAKLGVSSRTAAIAHAKNNGLLH